MRRKLSLFFIGCVLTSEPMLLRQRQISEAKIATSCPGFRKHKGDAHHFVLRLQRLMGREMAMGGSVVAIIIRKLNTNKRSVPDSMFQDA